MPEDKVIDGSNPNPPDRPDGYQQHRNEIHRLLRKKPVTYIQNDPLTKEPKDYQIKDGKRVETNGD